jgi:hypothetical protein
MEPILVSSAVAVPVWKTIAVGTFANSFALRNALDAAGCGNRNSVEEVLARPAFTLSATKTEVELFAVSAPELGFQTKQHRCRTFMRALNIWVLDLRQQRSLRN